MKLYIKQKVFSWRDQFAVKDETEHDRWLAQGKVFALRRTLHVYDADGVEVAFIWQKLLSFLPRYFIKIDGTEYEFVKAFTLIRQRYSIRNLNWLVEGNFLAHDYTVTDGDNQIMRIKKAWMTWGDVYEIDIADPKKELICLCIALTIDCMNADATGAAAGGTSH